MARPMWKTPKTKWSVDDSVVAADFNRLEGNLLNVVTLPIATGTSTALVVPMGTLFDGYSVSFIAAVSNGRLATTVNGINLYRPGTTNPPKLRSQWVYTIWYSLINNCFYYQV